MMDITNPKGIVNKYSTYKSIGEKWVNEIPEHWTILPLFAISTLKSITNCEDRELLSVFLDKGVINFSDVTEKRTNPTGSDLTN